MKISSSKVGAQNSRRKVDYEGEIYSMGVGFVDKTFAISIATEDRHVTVEIPLSKLDEMIEYYNEMKVKHPDYLK